MSAFDDIKKLFVGTFAELRQVSDTEVQIWSGPYSATDENDEEYAFSGYRVASFFFKDDRTISRIDSDRCHATPIMAQLRHSMRHIADILSSQGWYDLEDLKLHYHKVGKLVEVNVVSYCINWADHDGSAILAVEATFVYDAVANTLQIK